MGFDIIFAVVDLCEMSNLNLPILVKFYGLNHLIRRDLVEKIPKIIFPHAEIPLECHFRAS